MLLHPLLQPMLHPLLDPLLDPLHGAHRPWFPRTSSSILVFSTIVSLGGCFFESGGSGGDGGSQSANGSTSTAQASANNNAPPPPPVVTIPGGNAPSDVKAQPTSAGDAKRYMEQASFGPTDAGIQEVMQKGPALAIAEEFVKPGMGLQPMPAVDTDPRKQCPDNNAACLRDGYSMFPLQKQFFQNAIAGNDQLRQRVAFALSQIIVVSGNTIDPAYAMRNFQQMLLVNAFGNFRDILMETTLSPVMGAYLNMVNNVKADPAKGTEPNENYARELLQLFSVGEFALNPDGTRKVDAQGKPVNTYDQDTIENFARVFTGWTYPPRAGVASKFPNPQYFEGRMVAFAAQHDTGSKTLLNGAVLPAGQTPEKDVEDAVNNAFNHPNVGPYIGRQLIQYLVTSNPSPAYVARVSAAFDNNGQGVRGDMKAVIRAILLDAEARGEPKADVNAGKLREPVFFMTSLARGLNGTTDGVYFIEKSTTMGQPPYESPTVFNFYQPDYAPPGLDIVAPEFKIMQTGTVLARANFVHDLLIVKNESVTAQANVPGATGTRTGSNAFNALAATPAALVDRVATIFSSGDLGAAEKGAIVTAVNAIPANDPARRVRTAIYLVVTSAQAHVVK